MHLDYKDPMVKVLGVAKIHANNKMTVPKDLREHLSLSDGDYVKFTLDGNNVVVRKVEP
jgi:AbrB family looped-hinge helix DNA binding protein